MKPNSPKDFVRLLNVLGWLTFLWTLRVMAGCLQVWGGALPLEAQELFTQVYLVALTVYAGGTITERRVYKLPEQSQHRNRRFEYCVVGWLVFCLLTSLLLPFPAPLTMPFALFKEITSTTVWVLLIFGFTRTTKHAPEVWETIRTVLLGKSGGKP